MISHLAQDVDLLLNYVAILLKNREFVLAKPYKMAIASCKWFVLLFIIMLNFNVSAQAFLNLPIEGKYGKDFIIVNYVDWGKGIEILDHQCGNKTYAGHNGTDFVIRSFAKMDSGVHVVAAADGVITFIKDGLFDREKKSEPAKGFGNYIALRHFNGYYSYYAHLASKSMLVKVGDTVKVRQRMALVGSSGNSSDPHLHFEIWRDSIELVDPYRGSCGNLNTLWLDTSVYDTTFNIWTSGLTNFIPNLDLLRDEPAKKNQFSAADKSITYWAILYGLRKGDDLILNWYDPDDSLISTFSYKVPNDAWYFYHWSYINLPLFNKAGVWSVQFYRNDKFVDEIKYTIDFVSSVNKINNDIFLTIYPNPFDFYATICWRSQVSANTSLEVLDVLGRKVKTLVDEFRQYGDNTAYLDSKELQAGTYFYQLKVGNNITTRKLIIVK